MNATIIARTPTSFTLQVEIPPNDSMLDVEETLQERLNDAGVVATAQGSRQFDTDGSPITVGPVEFTTRAQVEKGYQTPHGVATVARHLDQSPEGGPTYCPLDRDARVVVTPTPRFAKIISRGSAESSSPRARVDLEADHGRAVSRRLIQDVADAAAAAVLAKEEEWSHAPPEFEESPATVAIRPDGTRLHLREDGWREARVGTPASHDREGERPRTVHLGATPEYGKAKSLGHPEAEVVRAEAKGPGAHHVGIADGAKGSWDFPGRHTDVPVPDFWHAAEYLGEAAVALSRGQPQAREAWLDDAGHRLEHEVGGGGVGAGAVAIVGAGASLGQG